MRNEETIKKIMTRNVITVNPERSLKEVEKLMKRNRIRHILVANGNDLVGIVSLTDLQRLSFVDSFGDDEALVDTAIYKMLTVDQIMVKNPVTVDANATIKAVADVLAKKEFHALPVLENNELTGIVTTTDLIRYMVGLLEAESVLA